MTKNEKSKLIEIIIVCVIAWVISSLLFNSWFLHKDAVIEPAHKEPKVFMTTTGECYHHYSCGQIKDNDYWEVGLETAKGYGLYPCSFCNGRSSGYIEYPDRVVEEEKNGYGVAFFTMFLAWGLVGFIWYAKASAFICEQERKSNEWKKENEKKAEEKRQEQIVIDSQILPNKSNANVGLNFSNAFQFTKEEIKDCFHLEEFVVQATNEFSFYISKIVNGERILKKHHKSVGLFNKVILFDMKTAKVFGVIITDKDKNDAVKNFIYINRVSDLGQQLWGREVGDIIGKDKDKVIDWGNDAYAILQIIDWNYNGDEQSEISSDYFDSNIILRDKYDIDIPDYDITNLDKDLAHKIWWETYQQHKELEFEHKSIFGVATSFYIKKFKLLYFRHFDGAMICYLNVPSDIVDKLYAIRLQNLRVNYFPSSIYSHIQQEYASIEVSKGKPDRFGDLKLDVSNTQELIEKLDFNTCTPSVVEMQNLIKKHLDEDYVIKENILFEAFFVGGHRVTYEIITDDKNPYYYTNISTIKSTSEFKDCIGLKTGDMWVRNDCIIGKIYGSWNDIYKNPEHYVFNMVDYKMRIREFQLDLIKREKDKIKELKLILSGKNQFENGETHSEEEIKERIEYLTEIVRIMKDNLYKE